MARSVLSAVPPSHQHSPLRASISAMMTQDEAFRIGLWDGWAYTSQAKGVPSECLWSWQEGFEAGVELRRSATLRPVHPRLASEMVEAMEESCTLEPIGCK